MLMTDRHEPATPQRPSSQISGHSEACWPSAWPTCCVRPVGPGLMLQMSVISVPDVGSKVFSPVGGDSVVYETTTLPAPEVLEIQQSTQWPTFRTTPDQRGGHNGVPRHRIKISSHPKEAAARNGSLLLRGLGSRLVHLLLKLLLSESVHELRSRRFRLECHVVLLG